MLLWWFSPDQKQAPSAQRLLPKQAVSGQPFPVAITLTSQSPKPVSLILKEILPKGAELISAVPPFADYDKSTGELKWLRKIDGNQVFAYMMKVARPQGETVDFAGTLARRKKRWGLIVLSYY